MIQKSNGSSGVWTFWLGSSGIWTFWLGFIGLTFCLGSSGIWTFWLAAIRLISYAFKGQMNDLCRKVKWSERPEPRASNIPGLGAWTRPPDRRWRITARKTLLAFRVLAAGAGKTSNTGQSASKRGLTQLATVQSRVSDLPV